METRDPFSTDYPAPRQADWIARNFSFHTGEILDLRLHYTTIGEPDGEPVLILHGTGGSGERMLTREFAGALFGPGQPLDAREHFIILPDAIGHGKSTKPSDGLRARFPRYNYSDLVRAQHELLTWGLGIANVRLVLGTSMGGMLTWLWGSTHPVFMDALVPLAALPAPMSGRNWMLRRLLVETILRDPAYADGDYATQPPSLRLANVFFHVATNGGTRALQARGATRRAADQYVDDLLAGPAPEDANDFVYQWRAAADYDPTRELQRIEAPSLAINSADDERNPPELGVMERALEGLPNARHYLIPASEDTRGHGTTGLAKFWAPQLAAFLRETPTRRGTRRGFAQAEAP